MRLFLSIVFTLALFSSCKKDFEGDAVKQLPPETYMIVDKISRSGDLRYTTTVEVHWWGASEGGFIKGYEISTDGMQSWVFSREQKGSFLLQIPPGGDTADIAVYVRAIDNMDQRDPTPASTLYPVKNTSPAVYPSFIAGKKPLRSYPAVHFYWTANDTDGVADIQAFELFLNDTTLAAFTVNGNVNDVTIVANRDGLGNFLNDGKVYTGTKTVPLPASINGLIFNQWNRFYIRAVDRAGSRSKWVIDSIFIKKPFSDILLINALNNSKLTVQNFYSIRLAGLGPSYSVFDTLQATEYDLSRASYNELAPDDHTQSKIFGFFNRIIWVSDDPDKSIGLAQTTTTAFFNASGRMLMVTELAPDYPSASTVFDYLPVHTLTSTNPGDFMRMNIGANMSPYKPGWPTLSATSILSSARAFYVPATSTSLFTYDSLYKADLLIQNTNGTTAWTGNSTVIATRRKLATGKPDLVFCSLPLHKLNGNNNVDSLFRKILIDELGF